MQPGEDSVSRVVVRDLMALAVGAAGVSGMVIHYDTSLINSLLFSVAWLCIAACRLSLTLRNPS